MANKTIKTKNNKQIQKILLGSRLSTRSLSCCKSYISDAILTNAPRRLHVDDAAL